SMANAEHAPAMASPVRTDEQIVPRNRWVPIGKSNCYLNEEKSQPNPIFKIAVDILKQTNFFRAFTASSTIPAIYIQQFWDTIRFDSKAGSYKCQLDEQWFNLTQDTLRDALQITPVDNNRAFSSPLTPDTLVEFVNKLGYPKEVMHLSNVTTNDMFQPWRAPSTIINLCLTGKTFGFKRPRAPVLQILWGIVNRAHIDYAERMCKIYSNTIHTFTEDQKEVGTTHSMGRESNSYPYPKYQFTKLIIFHLQRCKTFHPRPDSPLHLPTEEPVLGHLKFSAKGSKREVFGMSIPNELINNVIREANYYDAYLEKVAKHQRYIAGEELSELESPAPKPAKPIKQAKPKATKQQTVSKTKAKKSKPAPAKPKEKKRKPVSESSEAQPLAKRAKAGKVVKKRSVKSSKQLVDEFVDEGVPAAKPSLEDTEEAILQKVLEESLTDAYPTQRGPLPPVGEGKGKEKVGEEQAAQVLLNLQTPKKKSSAEQYIFQRRSHVPTETAGREDSTSLYAELGLYGSDTESDEEMPSVVRSGAQDEGQAGSDPGTRDEGQAGPNPDDVAESLPLPTPCVLAGPNLEHSDVEITDPSSQPQPEHMDEGFTATAYPDVQENLKLTVAEQMIPEEPVSSTGTLSSLQHLAKDFSFGDQFLNDKPSEADNEKTTADTEAESMVSVTIQQDTSIIPPMTSPVIDLVTRPDSPNVHWPLPTTTTTTAAPPPPTTTTTLPLPPQPQQGSSDSILIKRMGELEQHIADLVEENQALETRLDKQGNRIHKMETMDWPKMIREQTVEFIESQEIDRKIEESVKQVVISSVKHAMRAPLRARFKDLPTSDMKEILLQRMLEENYDKGHANHRVAYEALQDSIRHDEVEDFDVDKAQEETKKKTPPPPLPSSSTQQGDQSTSTAAPSSSKTAALAEYSAWTTTDTRVKPSITAIPDDLYMDDETTAYEQAVSSDDEVGRDHIPTVNLRQSWWKPLTEDRPATPEPAWTVPSSDLSMPTNNWASALKSTYAPPQENSLLAQTGDMVTFMDWYCKQRGISELTPKDLEGPAFEIVKVFHHDVIHLQFQMEECHKLLTDQMDDAILMYNVSKPLPLGGEPGHVTIQPDFFFNKDLEYLRHGRKRNASMTLQLCMVSLIGGFKDNDSTLADSYLKETDEQAIEPPDHREKKILTPLSTLTRNLATGFEFKHVYTVIDSPRAVYIQRQIRGSDDNEFNDIKQEQGLHVRYPKTAKGTRRHLRTLESFVGGRIREGDYRILREPKESALRPRLLTTKNALLSLEHEIIINLVLSALRRSDTENRLCKDLTKAKMEDGRTPRSSGVNSPPNAHHLMFPWEIIGLSKISVTVVKRAKDAAYHKEKMLLCKQEEAGFQLNAEQADWRDDTDDEPEDQELEAHYLYMAQIQEVTPDAADNSGPIFDAEPLQKVQNNDDNYNVFAIESEHPEQPESVNDTYPVEQDEHNIIIDSLDMSYDREQDYQDDNDDLAKECHFLASLIEKQKCEIDDRKNHNKFLETSNKALVDKLKGEIEDFKTKNKSLESSNNHFKEANNELSKTKQLMFKDIKKFQVELDRYHDVNYASKVAIDCAKAKRDLMSYKMESENFVKPEFLKKAQRANPRLYDIGCYNDNLALMLAPESDETIRLV
ncbi:hypothetical protein Tco_0781382, partial [Tanacetum coccineum]